MSFSIAATTRRLLAPRHELSCSWWLWRRLVAGLRLRGRGIRESGAFLLGTSEPGQPRHMSDFVLYDDLDPDCLASGIVRFDGRHYGKLWRACEARALNVVADVHTHPAGSWQSGSDRDHPMIAREGHVALIVPNFAAETSRSGIGIYRYGGNRSWTSISSDALSTFFFVGPW